MIKITRKCFALKGVSLMANPQLNHKPKVKAEDSSSLKGTLAAVFILGLFLIVSWIGVFYIFIDRF
jgi:hypothetical protein